jgi:hypothetical protein
MLGRSISCLRGDLFVSMRQVQAIFSYTYLHLLSLLYSVGFPLINDNKNDEELMDRLNDIGRIEEVGKLMSREDEPFVIRRAMRLSQ